MFAKQTYTRILVVNAVVFRPKALSPVLISLTAKLYGAALNAFHRLHIARFHEQPSLSCFHCGVG